MSDERDQSYIFPPDRKGPPADQVQQHPDEQDQGTPEPPPAGAQPNGPVIDLQANETPPQQEQTGRGALMKAAEAVPVKVHGAAPENFANQVTMAQYMAKAQLMVPAHFHGNVGDCLAIIDIATRAGLSPYMVAAKTYKNPNGNGIAFESQLYHAMLIASGWIKDSALHAEYDGTGGDRTCTVWATLKTESSPRYYESPPLRQVHPGYTLHSREGTTTTKKSLSYDEGQALQAEGLPAGAKLYSAGSPLWDDKPDVQHFYDTSRDWSRMFAPISTLGMLAQYEAQEHPLPPPGGIERDDSLRARIQATQEGAEGHRNGHAEAELAATAADRGTIQPAHEPTDIKPAGKTTKAKATPAKKAAEKKPTAAEKKKADAAAAAKAAAKRIADRAQETSDRNKAKQQAQEPPKVPAAPKTEAEYQVYAIDWIAKREPDPEKALARWNAERDLREQCGVRNGMRNDLRERLERKHGV